MERRSRSGTPLIGASHPLPLNRMMNRLRALAGVLLLVLLVACERDASGPAAPYTLAPAAAVARGPRPNLVPLRERAPGHRRHTTTLVATAGEAGEATLYFADGSPLATFRLAPHSLRGASLRGLPISAGDSITITLARVPGGRFVVDLEPSGLVFNPAAPAELTFFYRHAALPPGRRRLGIWRREHADELWRPIGGRDAPESGSIPTEIRGFTFDALAH